MLAAPGLLCSCSATLAYSPYAFGELETTPFTKIEKDGYYRMGQYGTLTAKDVPSFSPTLDTVYSFGTKRHLIPSTGEQKLHVIPVTFTDYDGTGVSPDYKIQIEQAFFGDGSFNQYESLASFYDKSSLHRLHLTGTVSDAYTSPLSLATLSTKKTAKDTKIALSDIYRGAVTWYNQQNYEDTLKVGDAVYFVYLAPYAEDASSRSSMLWAFTINDPGPVSWSSYFMMHPRVNGAVDAHTFIHEFGHMLGLVDYYDQTSYTDPAQISPMGRMDMMDCSLGEHNVFSKMLLNWTRPYIPAGEATITLRPSTGNGDCILLPLASYNDTPFDEYVLLELYTPTYLNYADSALRSDPGMSLMKDVGIRAYHIDARLGIFADRGGTFSSLLTPETPILGKNVDFHADNAGSAVKSGRGGYLIQCLDASSSSGKLTPYYIASDHEQDVAYGSLTAHLKDSLFRKGQGIDASFRDLTFHDGLKLTHGFRVEKLTSTGAEIAVFPLN